MRDIVDILECTSDALLTTGQDYSDVLLGAAAEIERLRGVMRRVANELGRENEGLVEMIRKALGE